MSVYCIGRNFADHAKELNNEIPTEPVVFLKPTSALVQGGGVIRFPASIGRVDHEVELVVKLGQRVPAHTPPGAALAYVSHYTVGIDVTGRDLQNTAKAKGMPWTLAKGMDTFAPMGPWVDRTLVDCAQVDLELSINGVVKQKGNTRDLIFSVPFVIAWLSRYFALTEGDLIFMGTPSGVGPLRSGDQVVAILGDRLATVACTVEEIGS